MTNELSVEDAIELLKEKRMEINYQVNGTTQFSEALDMAIKAFEKNIQPETCPITNGVCGYPIEDCCNCPNIQAVVEQTRWIPIKTRPLTEEEKEHYISIGWSEDSLEFIYNCPLPDDGQEVLITDSMGNVELDTFYSDDGCYFEDNCDDDEVIAWMPLPPSYQGE